MKNWIKGGIVGLLIYVGLAGFWQTGFYDPERSWIVLVMGLSPGTLANIPSSYLGVSNSFISFSFTFGKFGLLFLIGSLLGGFIEKLRNRENSQ